MECNLGCNLTILQSIRLLKSCMISKWIYNKLSMTITVLLSLSLCNIITPHKAKSQVLNRLKMKTQPIFIVGVAYFHFIDGHHCKQGKAESHMIENLRGQRKQWMLLIIASTCSKFPMQHRGRLFGSCLQLKQWISQISIKLPFNVHQICSFRLSLFFNVFDF